MTPLSHVANDSRPRNRIPTFTIISSLPLQPTLARLTHGRDASNLLLVPSTNGTDDALLTLSLQHPGSSRIIRIA